MGATINTNPLLGLTYDDISIIPSLGKVEHRSEIPLEGWRIVIAGMSSIISEPLLRELAQLPRELRCSIHIPRDKNSIKHLQLAAELNLQKWVWVGIGLNTSEIENEAFKLGFDQILVDIAFGGLPQLNGLGKKLKNKFGPSSKIVVGSICTEEQAAYLSRNGFDGFRIGQGGSSSICSTKFVSGSYIGVVSETLNVRKYIEECGLVEEGNFVFGDSSYKYPGDFTKSLLLGCDYCMSGYMFTKCKNAQMHLDGSHEYVGMSNKNKGIRSGKTNYDESFSVNVEVEENELKSLSDVLMEIWGGIRSGYSYSGFSTISEGIGKGEFCILKQPLNRNITSIK